MRYGPLGLIKSLLETFLDALDPYPNRKRTNVVHGDKVESGWSAKELSDAYAATKDDPGEKYWQDLLNQHLDEKERENAIISGMIVKDYEDRHNEGSVEGESGKETSEAVGEENSSEGSSEGTQDAAQDEGGEAGDMGAAGEADFDQGSDFDSGNFDADCSGNYDGYIG